MMCPLVKDAGVKLVKNCVWYHVLYFNSIYLFTASYFTIHVLKKPNELS